MALAPSTQRVVNFARGRGVEIRIFDFPDGTKTAADAAAAAGCELGAIAKSLVFMVDDEPVVALVPGDLRLDELRLAEAAGGDRARRARLEEARSATGYAAGGTPAFAYDEQLRVFADRNLQRYTEVWSAGGTPSTIFPIRLDDLLELSGAVWADIAHPL